ncbi:hypothetical protein K432DRAFT_415484 [Lepidopterella palustris CBS 459.81]|uniref:Uncharacterized protein n=1 Tax=Lepidopterella palustris CBS 459.81 TaxID=1314670 RepID=A0A8E2EED3_9PEZI|nr:hypothetical protein K432DRAFT_415484 [Lepidopterella palustris CBS 459.81]
MDGPPIALVDTDTKGGSLFEYLRIKIIVKGECHREGRVAASEIEKHDKPFNWQRLMVTGLENGTIGQNCFPGKDYVQQYATITAIYLAKTGPADIAIVDYVHSLSGYIQVGQWEGGNDDKLFSWKIKILFNGCKIAFLGCRVSFRGDIARNVRALVYDLAMFLTNCWSLTRAALSGGAMVEWKIPLHEYIGPSAVRRVHDSLPSETQDGFGWVDSDIGHMPKASLERNTLFGFLHIVSDNLARKNKHDLLNERLNEVISDRKALVEKIESVHDGFFRRCRLAEVL